VILAVSFLKTRTARLAFVLSQSQVHNGSRSLNPPLRFDRALLRDSLSLSLPCSRDALASIRANYSVITMFIVAVRPSLSRTAVRDHFPIPVASSIDSLARDRANTIYSPHFNPIPSHPPSARAHLLSRVQRPTISSALGPFGAIPIFARSSARASINSRERKRGKEREREREHYTDIYSPLLLLAHFNIPPINRPASSNQGVSHYPRLNFLQNRPVFLRKTSSLSNFRACKRTEAINSSSALFPFASFPSFSLSLSVSH